MAEVALENLYKNFGEVIAVDHINLTVNDGELLCFLGPSGCGKTTTLRMIAGLETPTSGTIKFDQVVVNHMHPRERNVAMVFENYALYPHKTVYDNIAYPLKVRKKSDSEIQQMVKHMAELLDILQLLNRLPRQLSGGQQQRVGIARALVRSPEALLLDEPISHLDAKLRARMRGELKRLQKDLGNTTILVTHDQLEAMTMADLIAVMDQGKILQVGTGNELFSAPLNLFVAKFIGEPSMNLLPCHLLEENGVSFLQIESSRFSISAELKHKILDQKTSDILLLGIRPQHVDIHQSKPELNEGYFQAQVYISEPIGVEQIVHLRTGSNVICSVTTSDKKINLDDTVWVKFNPLHGHVFDKASGNAIN